MWLTVNVEVAPDDTVDDLRARVGCAAGRAARAAPLPLLDPAPAGHYRVLSPMPPSHYEEAVARAVQRIRAGEFEKIVLARDVEVHAPVDHDPGAVLGLLREAFASCYVFAVGRGDATFVGGQPRAARPPRGAAGLDGGAGGLVAPQRRPGGRRPPRRAAAAEFDKDREENEIVVRRIARALRPHSVWVTAAPEPALVRVANIQHLGTPIRAQLAAPLSAIELAGVLHPTPAVGRRAARRWSRS